MPRPNRNRQPITLRLDSDTIEDLRREAADQKLSLSDVVENALKNRTVKPLTKQKEENKDD